VSTTAEQNSTEARKGLDALILGNHASGGKQSFAPPSASGRDDGPEVRLLFPLPNAQGTDLCGAIMPTALHRYPFASARKGSPNGSITRGTALTGRAGG
jgi:hypothetical protein